MNRKSLLSKDLPRWYGLTMDEATGFPCVVLHRSTINGFPQVDESNITDRRAELGLEQETYPLVSIFGETFGLGGCLTKISESEDWVTYRVELPKLRPDPPKIDWQAGFAISLSLMALLTGRIYMPPAEDTPTDKRQLLALRGMTRQGDNGGSLDGTISPAFSGFIESLGPEDLAPVGKATEALGYRLARLVSMRHKKKEGST